MPKQAVPYENHAENCHWLTLRKHIWNEPNYTGVSYDLISEGRNLKLDFVKNTQGDFISSKKNNADKLEDKLGGYIYGIMGDEACGNNTLVEPGDVNCKGSCNNDSSRDSNSDSLLHEGTDEFKKDHRKAEMIGNGIKNKSTIVNHRPLTMLGDSYDDKEEDEIVASDYLKTTMVEEDELSDTEGKPSSENLEASALEFFVNASKNNRPVKEHAGANKIEEVDIISDADEVSPPGASSTKLTGARKRKKNLNSGHYQQSSVAKKRMAVEVVDLNSDSDDSSSMDASVSVKRKNQVSNGNIMLPRISVPFKGTRPQSSVLLLKSTPNVFGRGTSSVLPRTLAPVVIVPGALLKSSIVQPGCSNRNSLKPLGNTGSNFVVIQSQTSSVPNANEPSSSSRPFSATEVSQLIMPTPDWNVNTYGQLFSISETVLSKKSVEIIQRSITLTKATGNTTFSVYGQLVPQFLSEFRAKTIDEVQNVLSKFNNVKICNGIESFDDVEKSVAMSSSFLSKWYRHVDYRFRSLKCPLVLTKSGSEGKQQVAGCNETDLCRACSVAKISLEHLDSTI